MDNGESGLNDCRGCVTPPRDELLLWPAENVLVTFFKFFNELDLAPTNVSCSVIP